MEKGRILIVDDDQDLLEAYSRILAKCGYSVEVATNEEQARAIVFNYNPDLIILDVLLGGCSGIDLLKELKSDARSSSAFIVLVSGKAKSGDEQSLGLESGADGYLVKPLNQRELVARADSFIRHKKTLDELRISEERFRKIVNRNADSIMIIDNSGMVRYANPAAANMFEQQQMLLINMEFGYPVVASESYEINIKSGRGFDKIAEMRTANIVWNNENMILASLRDVTERTRNEIRLNLQNEEIKRQNEDYKYLTEEYMVTNEELLESYEELRQANKQLEKTKKELSQLLQERNEAFRKLEYQKLELEKAKEKAEESNNLKSVFLASMSHELRSPLNAIIGFSEMIGPGLSDADLHKFATIIGNSGTNLLSIIDDTFNLALLDSGQAVVRNQYFLLNEFFDELNMSVEQLYLTYANKNVKVDYVPPETYPGPGIYTDKSKIQQVMLNLIKNAFKFTRKGSVRFGYVINEQENSVEFFVEDTGIGIPADKREIIFKRFVQLEGPGAKHVQGAGLGLSISKELVELLNGKITVESKYSKGSRFAFTLPYSGKEKQFSDEMQTDLGHVYECLNNRNVLVVEDEESNYLLIKSILKPFRVKLTHAWNGRQALKLYQEMGPCDFILMDLRLPVLDGFETTARIRKLNSDIPVLAVTAFAFKDELDRAKESGCNDVVIKPLRKNELLGKMVRLCSTK